MKRLRPFIILSIFCTLILSGSTFAQVPGYIGKKVHLQGGIKFFPAFGNFPVNLVQPQQYYAVSGMNYRLELGMDFMISRKSSVGFNTHYYNTANYYNTVVVTQDNRAAIDGGAIGAVFKTHLGSWVAPLGSYYRLEAGALIYSVSDPGNNHLGTFPATVGGTGYINNALGRTHIFANRISLDYGAELGFVFPPYEYTTVTGNTNLRLALHYVANVYVKIGGVF